MPRSLASDISLTLRLRKDADVVVDGHTLYTYRECLSMHRRSYLLIDLGEIPCIHHITTYVDNLYGSVYIFGMYIPIFLSVPYF